MKNGKYAARRSSGTKVFALLLAVLALVGCSVGATLAWLTAESGTVTNTFTVGDINITLLEHKIDADGKPTTETTNTINDYKIVPGSTASKDPFVTVKANSEACWLFVRIKEVNNTMKVGEADAKLVNWTIANGWTAVTDHPGYYYREVAATGTTDSNPIYVFTGDTTYTNGVVTYNENIVKGQVTENNKPQIIISAAAVQKDNVADVNAAFSHLPSSFTSTT